MFILFDGTHPISRVRVGRTYSVLVTHSSGPVGLNVGQREFVGHADSGVSP